MTEMIESSTVDHRAPDPYGRGRDLRWRPARVIGLGFSILPAMFAFGLPIVYFTAGVARLSGGVSIASTRIARWSVPADGIAAWCLALGIPLNDRSEEDTLPMGSRVGG